METEDEAQLHGLLAGPSKQPHGGRAGGGHGSRRCGCLLLPSYGTALSLLLSCLALVLLVLSWQRQLALDSNMASLAHRLSLHQQVAYTRYNLHHNLLPANTPLPDTHDYPYARTAVSTMISLDVYCLAGYLWYSQVRAFDPTRERDVVLLYREDQNTEAFERDPYCRALHRLSLLPRSRRTLPSGHSYGVGGLRLLPIPNIQPLLDAKGMKTPSMPNWAYALSKLAVFRMLEYDGVLFIDSDSIPTAPLDSFFALDVDMALGYDQYWGCHRRDELISGVFYFRPSQYLLSAVYQFFEPGFDVPCKHAAELPNVDQSVLNCICGSKEVDNHAWPDIHCGKLPWFTSVMPQMMYRHCSEYNPSLSLVIHYGGHPKPWVWDQKGCIDAEAKEATSCKPAEWFNQTESRRSCFTQEQVLFTYWHCVRSQQDAVLGRHRAREAWDQVDAEMTAGERCPCTMQHYFQ